MSADVHADEAVQGYRASQPHAVLVSRVRNACRLAALDEREECAQLVEKYASRDDSQAMRIAAAIRARGMP